VGGVLSRRARGYGWKRDDFSEPAAIFSTTPQAINGIRSKGAVYGGQAGYNWQFGRVVTGLEIDFSVTDIKGSNGVSDSIVVPGIGSGSGSITLSENVKYLGSARARLGWLPASNVLLYGTRALHGSGSIERRISRKTLWSSHQLPVQFLLPFPHGPRTTNSAGSQV
jgi:opacity protein-like surface antigen